MKQTALPEVHGLPAVVLVASVSAVVSGLLVILAYVLCSRRYRLNWFERTSLQDEESHHDRKFSAPFEDGYTGSRKCSSSTPKSHSSGATFFASNERIDIAGIMAAADERSQFHSITSVASSSHGPSSIGPTNPEFWVPQNLTQQNSITSSDHGTECSGTGDDSVPNTPNTPLAGVKLSPFAIQQYLLNSGGVIAPPGTLARHIQPPGSPGARPKLPSMHAKLDFTKINAAMYQKQQAAIQQVQENLRGSIQFTLSYDPHLGLFCIQIKQACDLVPRDFSGSADPYIKIRLLPDRKDARQSKVQRRTLNPVFDEDFAFDIAPNDLVRRTLELLLYDFDQYSRHLCLGCVRLPLEHVDLSDKLSIWKGIVACDEKDDKAELGDLMVSLGYLSSAERLTVIILKARHIRAVDDIKNTSDSYVKVCLIQNGRRVKKKKTSTQRNTLNPVFNEALSFSVSKEQLRTSTLEFVAVNDNLLGPNEILGKVVIGPDSKGEEAEHFRDLWSMKTAVARWHSMIDGSNLPNTLHRYCRLEPPLHRGVWQPFGQQEISAQSVRQSSPRQCFIRPGVAPGLQIPPI